MPQTKKIKNITFSDEKFFLDYLVFNLPRFRTRMNEIAEIFYKYRFNSKILNTNTGKFQTIFYNKNFTHSVAFAFEEETWNKNNLFLHFQGINSQRIYFIGSFLNKYKNRRNSFQSDVKKDILDHFDQLIKTKIIKPRFKILVDGNNFLTKDNFQSQDIHVAKIIWFYEIIYPI